MFSWCKYLTNQPPLSKPPVALLSPEVPCIKKFFKKIDATAQLTWLTEAIQQILSSDPEIKRRGMDRADLACWLCCSWLDRQLPEGS